MLPGAQLFQSFDEASVQPNLSEYKASPELAANFYQRATTILCPRGDVLFQKGEPGRNVYLIRSGEVALMLSLSPRRAMGFRADAGSLVGLPAAFSSQPYSMTAVVWKEADLAVMSREDFCAMVASNPALAFDVLKILAAETRSARITITEVGMNRRSRG